MYTTIYGSSLYHHGVKGQRWGIRRYQNPDGSLTPRGEKRVARLGAKITRKIKAGDRYKRRAGKFDKKAAIYYKKAERKHEKYDLGKHNKDARKAAKYMKKSAKRGLTNDAVASSRYAYKAEKYLKRANVLSKSAPYGKKALKLSVKTDKYKKKAAKARYKLAKSRAVTLRLKTKLSELT